MELLHIILAFHDSKRNVQNICLWNEPAKITSGETLQIQIENS